MGVFGRRSRAESSPWKDDHDRAAKWTDLPVQNEPTVADLDARP